MPVPFFKVAVCIMRTAAWPVFSVVSRRLKYKQRPTEENFFCWLGLKCFAFEALIERTIVQNNRVIGNDSGRKHKSEIEVSKICRKAAIEKGVDYAIDLVVFYGAFIALSLFWLHERARDQALLHT